MAVELHLLHCCVLHCLLDLKSSVLCLVYISRVHTSQTKNMFTKSFILGETTSPPVLLVPSERLGARSTQATYFFRSPFSFHWTVHFYTVLIEHITYLKTVLQFSGKQVLVKNQF